MPLLSLSLAKINANFKILVNFIPVNFCSC